MDKTKIFRKELWLAFANADRDRGILSQREVDDACKLWADDLDGKTYEQIEAESPYDPVLNREDWFE